MKTGLGGDGKGECMDGTGMGTTLKCAGLDGMGTSMCSLAGLYQ